MLRQAQVLEDFAPPPHSPGRACRRSAAEFGGVGAVVAVRALGGGVGVLVGTRRRVRDASAAPIWRTCLIRAQKEAAQGKRPRPRCYTRVMWGAFLVWREIPLCLGNAALDLLSTAMKKHKRHALSRRLRNKKKARYG